MNSPALTTHLSTNLRHVKLVVGQDDLFRNLGSADVSSDLRCFCQLPLLLASTVEPLEDLRLTVDDPTVVSSSQSYLRLGHFDLLGQQLSSVDIHGLRLLEGLLEDLHLGRCEVLVRPLCDSVGHSLRRILS